MPAHFVTVLYSYIFIVPKYDRIFGENVSFISFFCGSILMAFPDIQRRVSRSVIYALHIAFPALYKRKKAEYYWIFKGYNFRQNANVLDIIMSMALALSIIFLIFILFPFYIMCKAYFYFY